MRYRETIEDSLQYKIEYRDSIFSLIDSLETEAKEKHNAYIADIMKDKETYRKEICELFGFPLNCKTERNIPYVVSEKLSDEGEYSVYRMQIEVIGEHKITGLFFKYNDDEKRPFAVVSHGALGTPELISGIYESTANYNDMLERILQHGINVFAPQTLLWAEEDYGTENKRVEIDARLKRVGSSIVALESYSMIRIIDYFSVQPYTGKIGMAGLSYGGFFTQVVSALDTRIDAALTCSFFCDRGIYVMPDITRKDDIVKFSHAEMACLVHPRKLFIEMGKSDELFDYKRSIEEIETIREICGYDCSDWLDFIAFDGNHEFYKGDEHIDAFATYLKQEGI